MNTKKQTAERRVRDLQEECTYLTCLIQQHKLNSRARMSTVSSKYKKINVKQKCEASCSSISKSSEDSGTVKYKAMTTNMECNKVYFNPHFSKLNTLHKCEERRAENIVPEEKCDSLNAKHSVHVNPKVLAQILGSNAEATLTEEKRCTFVPSQVTECQIQAKKLFPEPEIFPSAATKEPFTNTGVIDDAPSKNYVICGKTKLIKQNTRADNVVRNLESASGSTVGVSASVGVSAKKYIICSKTKLVKQNSPSLSLKSDSRKYISRSQTKLVRHNYLHSNKVGESFNTALESTADVVAKKYVIHSKTKLVKRSAVNATKVFGNLDSASEFQRKKSPSVLKSSLSWPLLSVSRTKLVRAKQRKLQPTMCLPNALSRRSKLTRHSYSRNRRNSLYTVKAAKAVSSKYKLARVNSPRGVVVKSHVPETTQKSLYKIDRRLCRIPKRLKNVKKYSLQYEVQQPLQGGPTKRSFWKYKKSKYLVPELKLRWNWKYSFHPRRVVIRNKKLLRIGKTAGRSSSSASQQRSLVRIGGVLYKTSKLKLTRSTEPKRVKSLDSAKKAKVSSSFVVYVRGNKFLMDSSGKTLLRVAEEPMRNATESAAVPLRRVDIGGVTFVQKSTNVLIRTNTHTARNLLSQAKQRSIAMLTKKLRKSNQSCIFYHRFGKCAGKDRGTCPHVHDPKHIAICRKFLQGCCTAPDCLLSHEVGPEKMPTCRYFLEGCCVRDSCPYLHVKVNARAGICRSFLHGYCADGSKCRKRHVFLCPDYDSSGSCSRGKYCPYPHNTSVKKKTRTKKLVTDKKPEPEVAVRDERKRYYDTARNDMAKQEDGSSFDSKRLKLLKKVDDMKRCWLGADVPSASSLPESIAEPEARRPKLGVLPAFIPLDK